MAYSAFGINYGTEAQINSFTGDAAIPAQPIWAEDTHQLWIVHGTQGKYRIAMASDLSAYLKTADASKTYLGINAKAKSAGRSDSAATADTAEDSVKKVGNRSALSGYETISSTEAAVTIDNTSQDDLVVTGPVKITVSDGVVGQTWQKNVVIKNAGAIVAPGSKWKWVGGSAPEMKAPSLLVCKWAHDIGFLNLAVTE